MRLDMNTLRDFIKQEIAAVMKEKRQDEGNPYHGMKGSPNAGQFTSKSDDGSWAIGQKQYKYRSGKKAGKTSPCGRADTSRKRTCSKGVINDIKR
jgi:hypothetical protein